MDEFLPKKYKLPFEDKSLINTYDVEMLVEQGERIYGDNDFIDSVVDFFREHKGLTRRQIEGLENALDYENHKGEYNDRDDY